jgi:alanine racemase
MDMIMVDVTALPAVVPGEAVTLLGRDVDACVTVEEFAGWAGTIPHVVLASISSRVPRVYRG